MIEPSVGMRVVVNPRKGSDYWDDDRWLADCLGRTGTISEIVGIHVQISWDDPTFYGGLWTFGSVVVPIEQGDLDWRIT